eukprot:12041549-Alexandrium_andersonii.AAC.1
MQRVSGSSEDVAPSLRGAFLDGAAASTAFSGIGSFEQSLEVLRCYLCSGSSRSLPGARALFAAERDPDCQNE